MIRQFVEPDTDVVIELWREAGLTRPWNDPLADIRRKQATQPELFFVAEEDGAVVGSVMCGYDGHRGWIYYLAVAQDRRSTGIGGALIGRAESALLAMGCPKVQLQVRPENTGVVSLYEHLGYAPFEAINLGKRLIHDD